MNLYAMLYQLSDGTLEHSDRCKSFDCAVKLINPLTDGGKALLGYSVLYSEPTTALMWLHKRADGAEPIAVPSDEVAATLDTETMRGLVTKWRALADDMATDVRYRLVDVVSLRQRADHLEAYLDGRIAKATPSDMVLVPREPTAEMIAAAAIAVYPTASPADMETARIAADKVLMRMEAQPGATRESVAMAIVTMLPACRAMIAAAPAAQVAVPYAWHVRYKTYRGNPRWDLDKIYQAAESSRSPREIMVREIGELTKYPKPGELLEVVPLYAAAPAAVVDEAMAWRCFYCDETFTDRVAALEHFGPGDGYTRQSKTACQIDIAEYRRMEEKEARYAEEDAEVHRSMHRMAGEHQQALQRAEESGYARGLRDSGQCPCAAPPSQAVTPPLPQSVEKLIAELREIEGIRGAIGGTQEIGDHYRKRCGGFLMLNHEALVEALSRSGAVPAQDAEDAARLATLIRGCDDLLGMLKEACACWDTDQDSKVGKSLMAMAGYVGKYDKRATDFHEALIAARAVVAEDRTDG